MLALVAAIPSGQLECRGRQGRSSNACLYSTRARCCRVGQTRDARCPFEEFSSASSIVPAGAHDDRVEARPVEVRIVPDRRRRIDSTRSERRYEPPRVRVELRQFAAGGEATFGNVGSFIIMRTEYDLVVHSQG
jgi:hypothetical protein